MTAPAAYPVDLIALAISRLPHCYRSTNTEKAFRALLSPAPALAQAMWDCIWKRGIDTAEGVQIDAIGAIVGRPRNGVSDDEIYRRYCRAQISANKSSGIIEDILTIARLVVDDPGATMVNMNYGNGAAALEVAGIGLSEAVAAVLIDLLIKATSDGVRRVLVYSGVTASTVGRWTTHGTWGSARWARGIDRTFALGKPATAAAMATACRGGIWTAGYLCEDAGSPLTAAFGGTNLVQSGTPPIYQVPGPLGDKAVRVTVAASGWQAPNTAFLDPDATMDICGVIVARTAIPLSAATTMLSKTDFAGGPGFALTISSTTVTFQVDHTTPGNVAATATVSDAILSNNEWFAVMFALEHGAGTMRVALRSLDSGESSLGASQTIGALGSPSNAGAPFRVSLAGGLGNTLEIDAVYMGVSVGGAAGLNSGLADSLASFVAYLGTGG
jgi:hypothetical protein